MKLDTTKIKILQANHGYTQIDLAKMTGISRQGLNAILQRGTCTPHNLKRIADALGVQPIEIVKED